jgi:IMP dehydrogenase
MAADRSRWSGPVQARRSFYGRLLAMPDTVEIGLGRSARRGYHLDEIALVPTRRTRGSAVVSTGWQIDALSFDLPLITAPSDAVVSPANAREFDQLGGLALLNGEGLWTRYADAGTVLADLIDADDLGPALLQRIYAEPVKPELLRQRIGELRDADIRVAVRVSPQNAGELAPHAVAAGVDLLVIQGTVTSAEHVKGTDKSAESQGLNLKTFIADLDVPVVVGGCANYQTALHLMRTGAAGVIIGYGAHSGSTTPQALGIDVPMATALVDAAAARRDYLDETGGRYVHLIAYGDTYTGGDIAKALACGADAVMLGEPLAAAAEAPGGGLYWDPSASHPRMPRSSVVQVAEANDRPSLRELLVGATADPSGERSLFGSLRRAMAKCGFSTVKEFQKAELILTRRGF